MSQINEEIENLTSEEDKAFFKFIASFALILSDPPSNFESEVVVVWREKKCSEHKKSKPSQKNNEKEKSSSSEKTLTDASKETSVFPK